jgi:hypothetical protein
VHFAPAVWVETQGGGRRYELLGLNVKDTFVTWLILDTASQEINVQVSIID